jgi:hypothetical protein
VSDPGSAGSGHPPGLWPVPGEGVLARHGNLILLSSLEQGQIVDMLLDLLEQTAATGGDGRQFADQIAAALETVETGAGVPGPSVLAFGAAGPGLAVTVSGGAWADVTTADGTVRIAAGQPGMLLRCLLRSPVSVVNGGLSAAVTGPASTDRFSRLDAGTVRASGLSFYAGVAMTGGYTYQPAVQVQPPQVQPPQVQPVTPPQPPQPQPQPQQHPVVAPPSPVDLIGTERWQEPPPRPAPEPVPQPGPAPVPQPGPPQPGPPGGLHQAAAQPFAQDAESFESILLVNPNDGGPADLGVEQRAPLAKARDVPAGTSSYSSEAPIIQGVYCKNGHFDDPEALFCAVCGISMNQQTLINRPGTRPPLGVLLLDDGSVFQLDRDYVVGREPGLDPSVASGRSRALRIADDSGIVSRVHAKVALDGWRVLVTDLGSANGTRVRQPKNGGEQVLAPHQPFVLTTGSQVDLGGRGFRYESHRGR